MQTTLELETTSEALTSESATTVNELDLADLSMVGGGLAVLFY